MPELQARAQELAAHAADSIAGAVRAGDTAGIARRLQPFMDDATVAGHHGHRSRRHARSSAGSAAPRPLRARSRASASAPVRTLVENIPGAVTPETLATLTRGAGAGSAGAAGEPHRAACTPPPPRAPRLTLWLALALAAARRAARRGAGVARGEPAAAPGRLAHQERRAHRPGRLHAPARGAARARRARATCSRRSSACAAACAQSTDQQELPAQRAQQHDGRGVRHVAGRRHQDRQLRRLQAARLRRGGDCSARASLAVLEERERADFDLLQAAQETRETVVRTRAGQTIPVSFTGSRIDSDDPQFQGNIFVARNITDRKRAERRIRYLARYDALTKIPNRMQFHHLLQQTIARAPAQRPGGGAAVPGHGPLQGGQRHLRPRLRRPRARGAGRAPDALAAEGHRGRPPGRRRVRAVRRRAAGRFRQPRADRAAGALDAHRGLPRRSSSTSTRCS